jgi:hypothetical protein
MARSLLWIKLALAFGVCTVLLVGAAGQVRTAASMGRVLEQPTTTPPRSEATALEAETVQPAAEVICLWRACPAVMMHPRPALRTSPEAAPVSRRRVAFTS